MKKESKTASVVTKRDPHYAAATKEEQEALFSRYGVDKVKAVPGFRDMLLSDLSKALSPLKAVE